MQLAGCVMHRIMLGACARCNWCIVTCCTKQLKPMPVGSLICPPFSAPPFRPKCADTNCLQFSTGCTCSACKPGWTMPSNASGLCSVVRRHGKLIGQQGS